MDYGQPTNGLENKVDLPPNSVNNEEIISSSPERDLRKIGNEVLNTPDQISNQEGELNPTEKADSMMPPGYTEATTDEVDSEKTDNPEKKPHDKDYSQIREQNPQESANAILSEIDDFNKGKKSPADLVNAKTELSEAYLKNSFGREIGQ